MDKYPVLASYRGRLPVAMKPHKPHAPTVAVVHNVVHASKQSGPQMAKDPEVKFSLG